MSKVTPELLAQCLEDIEAGKVTVDECLAARETNREELRGLLSVASSIVEPPDIAPDPIFRSRARASLVAQVNGQRERQRGILSRSAGLVALLRAPALIATVMIVLAAAGGGIVQASQDSLPGDPLYSVKTAVEGARVALARDDDAKAATYLDIAATRLNEVERAQKLGNQEALVRATEALSRDVALIDQHIARAASKGSKVDYLSARLVDQLARQEASLAHSDRAIDDVSTKANKEKSPPKSPASEVNDAQSRRQPTRAPQPTLAPPNGISVAASAAITEAINEVQRLATQEPAPDGYKSLLAKLGAAEASLRRGQAATAGNNLDAFLDELNAMAKSGRLDARSYDSLYSRYHTLMTELGQSPMDKATTVPRSSAVTPTPRLDETTPGNRPDSRGTPNSSRGR